MDVEQLSTNSTICCCPEYSLFKIYLYNYCLWPCLSGIQALYDRKTRLGDWQSSLFASSLLPTLPLGDARRDPVQDRDDVSADEEAEDCDDKDDAKGASRDGGRSGIFGTLLQR